MFALLLIYEPCNVFLRELNHTHRNPLYKTYFAQADNAWRKHYVNLKQTRRRITAIKQETLQLNRTWNEVIGEFVLFCTDIHCASKNSFNQKADLCFQKDTEVPAQKSLIKTAKHNIKNRRKTQKKESSNLAFTVYTSSLLYIYIYILESSSR